LISNAPSLSTYAEVERSKPRDLNVPARINRSALFASLLVIVGGTINKANAAPPAAERRPIVVTKGPGPTINDDCPSLPDAQVRGLRCDEAAALIDKLKDAQKRLKGGEELTFQLLSGAPALSAMTKVSPRDAFLRMPFEKAFIIERVKTGNRLWQPTN
jgi:hypothetical protein